MRLPLAAAAAVAAVALPVAPADAAIYPVCGTALAAPAKTSAECSAGNTPFAATRLARIDVTVGAVDATLSCYTPYGIDSTPTVRVYSGNPVTLSRRDRSSCRVTIVAAAPNAAATAVTYPVPILYTIPPPPAA